MINLKIKSLQKTNEIYWGNFPEDRKKMEEVFDKVIEYIEKNFVGFKGLDFDWLDYREDMLKKVKRVKSYGEYISLLTELNIALKDGHTEIYTNRISQEIIRKAYSLDRNIFYHPYNENSPLIILNQDNISRIGGCFAITDDKRFVITETFEDNPYNLEIGDELVGFNGISWEEWYPRLIEANLPILNNAGSSNGAIEYNWLKSAMNNVNLFEKINIKKHDTGKIETYDIVFLELSLYSGNRDYCREYTGKHMFINGVNSENNLIESGIISNTNIAFVRLSSFLSGYDEFDKMSDWNPYETEFSDTFAEVIKSFMDTDGIIIDLRNNGGGRPELIYEGFAYLTPFEKEKRLFTILKRNPDNQDDLTDFVIEDAGNFFPLKPDEESLSYNNPIIILTGPKCGSACDLVVAMFSRLVPNSVIMGNHNNGAFSALQVSRNTIKFFYLGDHNPITNLNDVINVLIPTHLIAFDEDIDEYLLRRSDFIDYFVYPTKEDIINGVDTIRQFAIDYIMENN